MNERGIDDPDRATDPELGNEAGNPGAIEPGPEPDTSTAAEPDHGQAPEGEEPEFEI
ncbi:hypothetical protein [Microbacterium radiodurans]|uniref:hypothetical protein n=1 Tax=Microbacterium radiodurans TaxID=661398 RepID=UPI00168A617B|nr:hypothetical protein [Microbacterium radiodurans]